MKKLFQTIIFTLAGLIALLFVSAGCVQDAITPCYIPPELIEVYGDNLWSPVPYTTLWDAERIVRKTYFLLEGLNISMIGAREFQRNVFNPTGPLGLLAVGGPLFAAGAYGVSKPKDRKEIEKLKNGTA
ncbi:MAG: hypothetical protein JSW07_00325 [bacterium]|nr:MAG: hypothetical protein JSW07_00325 [bacterium]